MRYLWVEDFDGDNSNRSELEKTWTSYFGLKEGEYIIKENLEDALEFLDNRKNWQDFEAVLIDIRFKLSSQKSIEELYERYFKDFLLRDKFYSYAGKNNDASSGGILLYLALVFRYKMGTDRIAFVSANLPQTNKLTNKLRSIYEKIGEKGEKTEEYRDEYEQYNTDLDDKIGDIKIERQTPSWSELDPKKIGDYIAILREIDTVLSKTSNQSTTDYNKLATDFEQIGMKPPISFDKPDIGAEKPDDNISEEFAEWETEINSPYLKLRSAAMILCKNILTNLDSESKDKCAKPFADLPKQYGDIISEEELKAMLDSIIFDLSWDDNKNDDKYKAVVKDAVSIMDSVNADPKSKLNKLPGSDYANKMLLFRNIHILKLCRNWSVHQGIKDINEFGAFFILFLAANVYFDIENDIKKDFFNRFTEGEEYTQEADFTSARKKLIDTASDELYYNQRKSSPRSLDLTQNNYPKENINDYHLLTMDASIIGNEVSTLRKSVSIKHLCTAFSQKIPKYYAKGFEEMFMENELLAEIYKRKFYI